MRLQRQPLTIHSCLLLRIISLCLVGIWLIWVVLSPTEPIFTSTDTSDFHQIYNAVNTAANQEVYILQQANIAGWTSSLRREYAYLLAQQNNYRPLLALFNSDISLIESDEPFLKMLAYQQMKQGNLAQARHLWEQLLQLAPNDEEAFYQLALLAIPDDITQAMNYLVSLNESSSELGMQADQLLVALQQNDLLTLGLLLSEFEEWQTAQRVLTALISVEPMHWQAYLYRSYVRDQQGENGLSDLEIALGLADNPALPLYFLGIHWRTIDENLEAAVAAFELAAKLDPQNASIAIELAITYQEMGHDDLAATWYDAALRLEPHKVEWHRLRAAFYAERDVEVVDIRPIEQSLVLFPNDAHLLTSLGYAYYQLGDYVMARTYLVQAVELDPNSARTQYYYAVAMEQFGDLSAAIGGYWAAYELRVSSPNTYTILAERALQRLRVLS